jgi:hypothetical protein
MTFLNRVTQVILFIVIFKSSLLVTFYVKSAKELYFINWKIVTCLNKSPGCNIACGIRELHATLIMFSNTAGELKFE